MPKMHGAEVIVSKDEEWKPRSSFTICKPARTIAASVSRVVTQPPSERVQKKLLGGTLEAAKRGLLGADLLIKAELTVGRRRRSRDQLLGRSISSIL